MLRPYRDVTGSRRLTEPYASIDRREGQLPSAGPDRAAQVTRPELARDREGKVGHQVAVHGLRPHLRAEIRRQVERDAAVHGAECNLLRPVRPATLGRD